MHVPTAHGLHIEEAIVVNVLHHEGNLIAMSGQHKARRTLGVKDRDDVAVPIRTHLVGQRFGPGANDVLDLLFVAGRTWCEQ